MPLAELCKVRAQFLANDDRHAKFFFYFTDQGRLRLLTIFDLSARELPFETRWPPCKALGSHDLAIEEDDPGNDVKVDEGLWRFLGGGGHKCFASLAGSESKVCSRSSILERSSSFIALPSALQ